MNLTAISSEPTLADAAYRRVESLIVTLQLEPGSTFSEAQLSSALDVGRTPLREALQRLSGEGLITAMPRRGMMVAPIDLRQMLYVIETRKVLDGLILSGTAKKATDRERLAIRAAQDELSQIDDSTRFMAADYRLDKAIWDACPNQFAVEAARPLHAHCRRFWFKHRNDEDLQRSADLHDAAVEAVLRGDPVAARERSDKLMDYLTLFTKHVLIAG